MKILLIIRDGWGHGKHNEGNAIWKANTPNHDSYTSRYPTTVLKCTGHDVGNPEGVQGGSEVGHLTIGAGRIVWQPYELINIQVKNCEFQKNKAINEAIDHCIEKGSDLHIDGLFSDQGVHADYRHMHEILKLCKAKGFDRVFIHLTLDGRDVPERSAQGFIQDTESTIKELGVGRIASVVGRFYAMDRDKNWERTRMAYDLLVEGKGHSAGSAKEAVEQAYARGDKTDYYIEPTVVLQDDLPIGLLKDKDSMIWYNFRSDRSRQITAMIMGLGYCPELPEKRVDVHYTCFCSYDSNWGLPVAFPQESIQNNLGETVSKAGLKQMRISETEKYAHVTFFFNSQKEDPYPGEERIMVPSPKVPSYDLKPEMSAFELTEKLLDSIGNFDLIVTNFANPDLVGHSGVFSAVVRACEVVDECVGRAVAKAVEMGYCVLLMADHGNADHMLSDNDEVDPSHGFNPVLLTIISNDERLTKAKLRQGLGQKDVAVTILEIMGLDKPKEMTGESLLIDYSLD